MDIRRKYPGIADLQRAAPRRIPGFAWEFLIGGVGAETCLGRNRAALDVIRFMPHYLGGAVRPDLSATLMGRCYDLPFGVAPMGLGGLIRPRAADVPTAAKRDRDIRNGLSVSSRFDMRTLAQILARPRWALETLRTGLPEFRMLTPYVSKGASLTELGAFLTEVMEGHVTPERLKAIRDAWPGRLVVKGALDPTDAEECRRIGADALVVSNHGWRQLDAAPTAPEVLAEVRAAAGSNMAILADGGMRSGLDVARILAAGADFVLIGRAFIFGVAALGAGGGDHVVATLAEELCSTLGQIGCARVADLPRFRAP